MSRETAKKLFAMLDTVKGADQENKHVLTPSEMAKAVYFPEGIIGDPNAKSSLKDYAFHILQQRNGKI